MLCQYIYLIDHFEVQAQGGGGAEAAHFPLAGATDAHLLHDNKRQLHTLLGCGSKAAGRRDGGRGLTFSDTQGPLELRETQGPTVPHTFSSLDVCSGEDASVKSRNMSPSASSPPPLRAHLHFQDASEGHAEVTVVVFAEDPLEGLLEQGGVEGVAHHDVTPVAATSQSPSSV